MLKRFLMSILIFGVFIAVPYELYGTLKENGKDVVCISLQDDFRDFKFDTEKFNAAIEASKKGGLPVVLVNVNSEDYLLEIKKNIFEKKDFIARAGKDFQLFLLDFDCDISNIKNVRRKLIADSITVYHGNDFHTKSLLLKTMHCNEYCEETLKYLKPSHIINKYKGYHGPRNAYTDWKAGKLNINEYDRDGKHVFHKLFENTYPGFDISDDIFIEMVNYLSKQNLPKDFWSYTLHLHTQRISRYSYEEPRGWNRTLKQWCDITDILVKAGADPNYADEYGISTAFVYFSKTSHNYSRYDTKARYYAPAARKLLEHGMDFNRIYPNKRYPLQSSSFIRPNEFPIIAAGEAPWGRVWNYYNWEEVLFILDNFKINIDTQQFGGGTLLNRVITQGGQNIRLSAKNDRKKTSELIDDLLKRGASPSAAISTYYYRMPLFMFVCKNLDKNGYEEIFHQLLKAGADVNLFWKDPKSYFKNDKNYTGDSIFTIMPEKYKVRKDIVDLLLAHGIKPELIDNTDAINAGNEELALYILEKGGYTRYDYKSAVRLKRTMPRLAEAISKLPPERVRPTIWDRTVKPKTAFSGTEEKRALLSEAAALLENYASFVFHKVDFVCFSTCKMAKQSQLSFLQAPAYYSRYKMFPGGFIALDRALLVDYYKCKTEQEKNVFKVKLALMIAEAYELQNGIWHHLFNWYNGYELFNYGRENNIIWLKQLEIKNLVNMLNYAAKLYLFMPENKDYALKYFPPSTAGFLKKRLDALPPGMNQESVEASLREIIGDLAIAYWQGQPPVYCKDIQKDIEQFWNRRSFYMQKQLDYMLTITKKIPRQFNPPNFLKYQYSTLRHYVPEFIIYDKYHNHTFKVVRPRNMIKKIEYCTQNFLGSEESRRNLFELLKFMQQLPTARKLLEKMPEELCFISGTLEENKGGVYISSEKKIRLPENILRFVKFNKTPERTVKIIQFIVHELTHAEQDFHGIWNFKATNQNECYAANKLIEMHPLLNQYMILRELMMYPEYKDAAAEAAGVGFDKVADFVYNQYQGFWHSKKQWREEFVKLIWNNAQNFNTRDSKAEEKKLYDIVRDWNLSYRTQFGNTKALRMKTGINFAELGKKFSELMDVELDADYYINNVNTNLD